MHGGGLSIIKWVESVSLEKADMALQHSVSIVQEY